MKTVRVVDIESTGTDPTKHAICEIASVDVDVSEENGKRFTRLMASRSQMVAPGHPMPAEARAIHHIGDDDLKEARPFKSIKDLVLTCYPEPIAYCAHYAQFEMGFLAKFTGGVPWLCTWKCALRRWPQAPSHSNQALRYWLALEIPSRHPTMPPHRALPDTVVTAHILCKLLEDTSIEDLLAWSAEPPLMPTCPIGDHRGKPWAAVPGDFLLWMLGKESMEADLKWNAKRELDRRAADTGKQHRLAYVEGAKQAIKTAITVEGLRDWYASETSKRHELGIRAGTEEAQEIADACIARKTELLTITPQQGKQHALETQ